MKYFPKLRFILLLVFGIVTLSSARPSLASKESEPVIVQISLNDIKPGLITVEQLLTVKRIRVFSIEGNAKEKEYKIEFCRIALIPFSGKSSKIDMEGNDITRNLYEVFGYAKPGDWLIIGNLKIEGLTNFKFNIQPSWTITDKKKQ
jgi:hypothetical protein